MGLHESIGDEKGGILGTQRMYRSVLSGERERERETARIYGIRSGAVFLLFSCRWSVELMDIFKFFV
jgi:hypothetical protein